MHYGKNLIISVCNFDKKVSHFRLQLPIKDIHVNFLIFFLVADKVVDFLTMSFNLSQMLNKYTRNHIAH